MNRTSFEDLFLEYVEGTLTGAKLAELEAALAADADLQRSLERYREVVAHERSRAARSFEPNPGFSVTVMRRVKRRGGFMERLRMWIAMNRKVAASLLATTAVAVLVVRLGQDVPLSHLTFNPTAQQELSPLRSPSTGPVVPIPRDSAGAGDPATPAAPSHLLLPNIPEGHRAITVDISASAAIEGAAPSSSAIDIYAVGKAEPGRSPVLIAQDAQVLSRQRDPASGQQQVTLVVPAEEAHKLALAQSSGGIQLHPKSGLAQAEAQRKESYPGTDDKLRRQSAPAVAPLTLHPHDAAGTEALVKEELNSWRIHQPDYLPPAPSYERYIGQADSPPILVSQEAVSTFSIDVDTASYTNARRFIEQGQLPPREAVRTEEFLNYFEYTYPVQHERPFTLSYELAPSPITAGRILLKLGIKAKDAVEDRKPWNLVFLIDTSGSMSPENKLPLVRRALKVLADRMRPTDRVAIVTYAGSSEVKLHSTSGAEQGTIGTVIDTLTPYGSTNGSGGIQTAYTIARQHRGPGVNRVVLVTDGDFNVGVTSHEDLVRMIERERQSGISLTTIGVGEGNLNDALLEQLANRGDGNYFYLDSLHEARRVFAEKIAGTMETVAKDVKLQLEFNPKHVVQYKLIGYENRTLARQDFNNDAVDAGEIGTGHTVTALYELVLAGTPGATALVDASRYQPAPTRAEVETPGQFDGEIGFLKIRYKAPEGGSSQLLQFPIAVKDVRRGIGESSLDFRFAAAIAGFAQSLRGALPAGATLDQLIALAESGLGADPRGERRAAIELMRSARVLQGHPAAPVFRGYGNEPHPPVVPEGVVR